MTGDIDAAHDLTQEAFLRAWRSRKQLREPLAAKVWILRIAQNLWRDHLRRKKRHEPPEGLPGEDREPAIAAGEEDRLGREEEVEIVIQAMSCLPARQRQVLHLNAFEGLRYQEIAEVLEISENAVKASLSLARKALRARLDRVRPRGRGC